MRRLLGTPNLILLFLCCVVATGLTSCTKAEPTRSATVTPDVTREIHINPDELERFADGFFPQQLENLHIPGLTIVIVQDGQVVFAKGYGSANLETGVPFNPDETVVRIGSISKLFVATAVMQLV